jgi:hypothetical protein
MQSNLGLKFNPRLSKFNPRLALIGFWTTGPRSKYKCLHVISPERNKAILTWIIQNIVDLWKSNIYHASTIQNKFWPPPSFKKTSWSLNYFPGIMTSLQTDRHKFSNRNLDRLYISRPKRLDTSKRRHAILHVKNSVLPSAAMNPLVLLANLEPWLICALLVTCDAIKSCGTGVHHEHVVFNRKSGVISGIIRDNVGIERKIKTSAIHRCPVLSSFQHRRTTKCEKQRYFKHFLVQNVRRVR